MTNELPHGQSILLLKNESIDFTSQANSMLSVNQLRANGIDVDDCPKLYQVAGRQGRQSMIVGQDEDDQDVEVPFEFDRGLISYTIHKPTEADISNLPVYVLTSDHPWNPNDPSDSQANVISMVPVLSGHNIPPSSRKIHELLSRRQLLHILFH